MILDKTLKRKYFLKDYEPEWPRKFGEIKVLLQTVFKEKALRIAHVGSTAVVGMRAKPVIDVLVVVDKIEDFSKEKEQLMLAGYVWGENYVAPDTLIFYKEENDGSKTANIHVCERGSPIERLYFALRVFFRAFPEKAKEYSDLKAVNFALYPDDYPAYREAKSAFLLRIMQEAYDWADSKGIKLDGSEES